MAAAPNITVVNDSDVTVASWNVGTVQANTSSAILTILVWNNKGGSTSISDLQGSSITAVDDSGNTTDPVKEKWTKVNCQATDGNTTSYSGVGGTTVKMIKADGASGTDNVIKGTNNDGNKNTAGSKQCYCTLRLKVIVPLAAKAGSYSYKMRINGYYT